jgi:curli biogenesis system outer membrane secretion channel CsgG
MRKLSIIAGLILGIAVTGSAQQKKKRVAVLNFEYGTVSSSVAQIFGTNVDIGKGIADLLVERLVNGGQYSVIERKALDKVLAEQNFSNSDRADPSSAAKLGRILGVDAIVIGSITQFGRDDKSQNIGGLGSVTGRFGIGGVGKREAKAVVAVSGRMVSTETAEILAVATGKGESTRGGTTLLGAGGSGTAVGAGAYDMSSSNFGNTIIGEATNKAVADMAGQLDQNASKLPTTVIKVDGLVADVSGSSLVLNIGTSSGVKVGDRLEVSRVTRTVTDPATGKVLRRITSKLGEVKITEADASSSVGTYSGSMPPKVGDAVGSPAQ